MRGFKHLQSTTKSFRLLSLDVVRLPGSCSGSSNGGSSSSNSSSSGGGGR